MNGKGSAARPFSVDAETFSGNMRRTLSNPRDAYREAVLQPDFFEKYPLLIGVWSSDRDLWMKWYEMGLTD